MEYLTRYLSERFGNDDCLTAEYSLLRHAQYNVIRKTVDVLLAVNQRRVQPLAFGPTVALFPGKSTSPSPDRRVQRHGLQCVAIPHCRVNLPPRHFTA